MVFRIVDVDAGGFEAFLHGEQRRIKVANMPGTNSQAVAEMRLLLILGALRRITWLDRRVRAGEGWSLIE